MACADVPSISNNLYKRYEKIIGSTIEKEAENSCKRAAIEERKLVIEKITKLCEELPQDIIQDIYPQLDIVKTSLPSNNESNSIAFDQAVSEIVNIIVGYDTGWSKRGNGRSYDSLNSYSTIIGFLSGKVLDYTTRNRKCIKCDLGHKKEDHDCRMNFQGSAKAMEADAGVKLINHSKVLKEVGLQVRVIIGDEDSSMIAAVRNDNPDVNFHKLADKNHLSKNFSNELYKMRNKHKQLNRKGIISHIKKCFNYAVSQNKGKSECLANALKKLPDHFSGRHENCENWCKPKSKHTIQLSESDLYDELVQFFRKYAANANKFSIAASSQANESFNNIVVNKAAKNKCLSRSAACDFRVADSVCVKNDGEQSILKMQKGLGISEGTHSAKYAIVADSKRFKRSLQDKLKSSKLRRLELKRKRESLRKSKEKTEGITYQTNCGIDTMINKIDESSKKISKNEVSIFYFDLETTGFAPNAHIIQIAAKSNETLFNVYVKPKEKISSGASKATGLHCINNTLYFHNQQLLTLTITEALRSFQQFLNSVSQAKKCLLVAHKASFDASRFCRAIINNNMVNDFSMIAGFSDSLTAFKKKFPDRKGPQMFTLETLSKDFLEPQDSQNFHDAAYDVTILQNLVLILNCEDYLFNSMKSFDDYYKLVLETNKINYNSQFLIDLQNTVSQQILKRLALHDITYDSLLKLYESGGEKEIQNLFTEKVEKNKPRITTNKKIIEKVIAFLKYKTNRK